nr:immunoglobulin light chain junction region [Macaca mulatta]MOW59805.1 immunoglobulin light chain junction region [Macaca mulatta]MOW60994.1 immunoglobulin light chain junction region [Macaca mulatta]
DYYCGTWDSSLTVYVF